MSYGYGQKSYGYKKPSYVQPTTRAHARSYAPKHTPEPVKAHPHTHESAEYDEGCDIGGSSASASVYDYDSTWWTPTK